jgi:predicted alpha/beta-hydrolase family hydrolase
MLAAAHPELASGLLLLSYPLHPPKQREQLRTAHFSALTTRALFVHGSRDGFGSIEEVSAALALIPAPTELLPVMAAGHELLTSRNREELPGLVVDKFRTFLLDA